MTTEPARVFISYSHDSPTHKRKVFQLATKLRRDGVDAWIDQFESRPGPPQGWLRWMYQQLHMSRFTIVVCTANYRRRFEGTADGTGATWEGMILGTLLFPVTTANHRIIALRFQPEPTSSVPGILQDYGSFSLPEEYKDLLSRLTGQSLPPPPLGPVRPRSRRSSVPRVSSALSVEPARSEGLPQEEGPSPIRAIETIEDLRRDTAAIEKHTPFRRHLRDRLLMSAQLAVQEIAARRLSQGTADFSSRVREELAEPQQGSVALALCGEKGLEPAELDSYYAAFYRFARLLKTKERRDRIRVCRIFMEADKMSPSRRTEWDRHIKGHRSHQRDGVEALVVPAAGRAALGRSELAGGLEHMNREFGFGLVVIQTPRRVIALTHAWDQPTGHPDRKYRWVEWHDPLNVREIIRFFSHVLAFTEEYSKRDKPKWRDFTTQLLFSR